MSKEDFKTTVTNTIIVFIINWLCPFLIIVLSAVSVYIISVKERLLKCKSYVEISFWLLLIITVVAVLVVALMLKYMLRMYFRYKILRIAFGVYWDKNYNMFCLSCKKPLKHNSDEGQPQKIWCSDPKCNSKYVLKDDDAKLISFPDAIKKLKKLEKPSIFKRIFNTS